MLTPNLLLDILGVSLIIIIPILEIVLKPTEKIRQYIKKNFFDWKTSLNELNVKLLELAPN